MAQADYVIANAVFDDLITDLNGQLAAIVTNNSDSSEPGATFAGMFWVDETATPWTLKIRDHTDNTWASLFDTDGNIDAADIDATGDLQVGGDAVVDGDFTVTSGVTKITGPDPLSPIGGTGLVTIESNNSQAANRGPFLAFRAKYTDAGAFAGLGGILVAKANSTSGNLNSYMAFYTRLSSASERMRLDENGNLDILAGGLTVTGDVVMESDLQVDGDVSLPDGIIDVTSTAASAVATITRNVASASGLGVLEIIQNHTAGIISPLYLQQDDVDKTLIEFVSTIGIGNAIEAVGSKSLTVTHFLKISIPPLTRYIAVGTIA